MTTEARPWNACERCNRLLLHFNQWFQQDCQNPSQGHKLSVENWMRLPWDTQEELKEETRA